jgi:NAD-dependent SIR2 family protein deacetylase
VLFGNKTKEYEQKLSQLKKALQEAETVVIGAGAGLSTAAGFVYSGERFQTYFGDFHRKYGFADMYSGGFYPFSSPQEHWAYWSRFVYVNRYMDPPSNLYGDVLALVADKDYFVLTTNVDHCFQKAGVDKHRLFYTQGDYGLFQCSEPCCQETFDNAASVADMMADQGFVLGPNGEAALPENGQLSMAVRPELVPRCPHCGKPMTMNLRSDNKFVEDEGWHQAAERYSNFLRTRRNTAVLYLELGVGYNTPSIIKYPFWQMTDQNPKATFVSLNRSKALCPQEIESQSICINGDIAKTLADLQQAEA